MTEYRIFPSTSGPASTSEDSPINLGTQFQVSGNAWITKLHYWEPADGNADGAILMRVWTVTGAGTGTALAGTDAGGAGKPQFTTGTGQWRTATLSPAVPIVSGTVYKVGALYPSGYGASANFWANGGAGTSGITNGVLTALSKAAATNGEQGSFDYDSGYSYPANPSGNGANYWVDVTVSDTDPAGGSPQTVSPPSIAPAGGTGSPVLSAGPVTVSPASIAPTGGPGAPTLTPGPVTVSPPSIAPTGGAGGAAVSAGAVTVSLPSIEPTGGAGTPVVGTDSVTVSPPSIAPTGGAGPPSVSRGPVTVALPSIAPTGGPGAPAVNRGPVTVSPGSIAPSGGVGNLDVRQIITPPSIGPTGGAGVFTVSPGAVSVFPPSIAPGGGPGSPAVNPEAQRGDTLVITVGPPEVGDWVFGSLEVV